MRHNLYNPTVQFVAAPQEFNKNTETTFLQYCLGATLYMPGTKEITDKILGGGMPDLTSMVLCLEDAISESDLPEGERNILLHLDSLHDALQNGQISIDDIPLTFVRVRGVEQFASFSGRLTTAQAHMLTGFVFPKFYSDNANEYLKRLVEVNERLGVSLYAMPILEGSSIAFVETRIPELLSLKQTLDSYKDRILNIRVGGTDFSSFFGVRREISSSIYDILPVSSCLADILNVFNRARDGYSVSGPVWEYFLAYKREDLTHLLEADLHHSLLRRNAIINDAVDGLLREVVLDKANGFVGKTIIHPSHVRFVNAMQAVTREEYDDAMQIRSLGGGVAKSAKANKMNEVSPHRNWATRIINRARAYGVIEDETAYLKLILG